MTISTDHAQAGRRKRHGRALSLVPLALLALAACALSPAEARAQEQPSFAVAAGADAGVEPAKEAVVPRNRRFFVGASGGFALVTAAHPDLGTQHLMGAVLGLQAGYVLSPKWSVSLELTSFETALERQTPGERFSTATSWLRPQAGCDTCPPRIEPEGSSYLVETSIHLTSVSPRIEVTPFGTDGLYIGASAGLALLGGLDSRAGAAGTARAGFRLRPVKSLTLAIEAGAQGQAFADASAGLFFTAAQGRLHF